MKNIWHWITKREPLFVAGLAVGVGLFFVIRYGTHAIVAVQALTGTGATLVFTTLRQFVTSPAGRQALTDAQGDLSTLPGLIADVDSLKQQVGPLSDVKGGLGGWVKWVDDLVKNKGSELVAVGEAIKTDLAAMVHHPAVSTDPPKTATIGGSMLAVTQDAPKTTVAPVTLTQPGDVQVTVPTVAEPASQAQLDAVAELAKLVS